MKILVFSDSHGRSSQMETAIALHKDASYVFFLGDGLREVEYLRDLHPEMTFVAVRGNCDFFASDASFERILDIEGYRFFLCHGHTQAVKWELCRIYRTAIETKVDVALFGHTHKPHEEYISDGERPVYLFNPGSISHSDDGRAHYGLIQISRSGILLSHGTL